MLMKINMFVSVEVLTKALLLLLVLLFSMYFKQWKYFERSCLFWHAHLIRRYPL